MENDFHITARGSNHRQPYNAMIRERGDAVAQLILAKPAGYTSPGGKQVYFVPDCADFSQALSTGLFFQANDFADIRRIHDVTLAACKAVTRLSEGKARARTIVLDDRFQRWVFEYHQRANEPVMNHRELIAAYCQQTGERIERRDALDRSCVSFEARDAYREGYVDAIAEHFGALHFSRDDTRTLADRAVAGWVAKQEGR